jgi:hypothetical protein
MLHPEKIQNERLSDGQLYENEILGLVAFLQLKLMQ